MRILLASYGSLKTRGGWFYGTAQKLQNGFVRLGHAVEFFSDRDIARAASPIRSRIMGRRACNRTFKDYVRNYDPHLIVLCHADLIANETLAEVKASFPAKRIVEVRVDALHNVLTIPHMRARAHVIDRSFVTTGGRALDLVGTPTAPACFIPNPVDSGMEAGEAHLSDDQPFDAIYSRRPVIEMPSDDYRAEIVTTLERDPSLKVFSIGIHGGSQIFGQAYFDHICNARIGLNLSVKAAAPIGGIGPADLMRFYSSDRIAHYGGNGLAIMNPAEFSFDELLRDGQEFVSFSSPAEALEQVRWLAHNPAERMRMASASHRAFHDRFSSERVAEFIVARSFGEPVPAACSWPAEEFAGQLS
ncbi:MAG: glycosyltransferase [Beijerinckiaceae bacterium]|nr:glycosyltransferase [Beijerinckiaceae bacterium]